MKKLTTKARAFELSISKQTKRNIKYSSNLIVIERIYVLVNTWIFLSTVLIRRKCVKMVKAEIMTNYKGKVRT